MFEPPSPATVIDEPCCAPELKAKIPAPEIVAVMDSGLAVPAAFFVTTAMYAAGVLDAVANAEILASLVALADVPINAVDEPGLIVDDSDASAATVRVISRVCTLVVNSELLLYGVNIAVQTYVPAARPAAAVAVSTNALNVAAAVVFAALFMATVVLDSVLDTCAV
jgi:hypothetical protein